jgi:hypothetical protein
MSQYRHIKLTDLFKKIDLKATLMVLPDINELLALTGKANPLELRVELLKQSIDRWFHQVPLIMLRKVNLYPGFKFRSNFQSFCQGLITDEDLVELEPTRVISINRLASYAPTYGLRFRHPEVVYEGPSLDNAVVNAIYKLPLYYDFNDLNQLVPESTLGFLEDRHVEAFIKQCLLDQIDYIIQLNRNFEYPMLPVQLFGGLDEKKMNLQQEVETYYLALTHGLSYF